MNELQRQKYLSALGLDSYMPRWHLPFAPVSVECDFSQIDTHQWLTPETSISATPTTEIPKLLAEQSKPIIDRLDSVQRRIPAEPTAINNLIVDIFQTKKNEKPASLAIDSETILAQQKAKSLTIEPFMLSVWRPVDGVMIVDSRNTKLALPTELFLSNIVRYVFTNQSLQLQEEILRWPMIEKSFAKYGVEDARTELQTWLSVQHEIRPIKYLWLMGSNSVAYLLDEEIDFEKHLFSSSPIPSADVNALVLPSLNDILRKPSLKKQLFSAIHRYHK